MSSDDDIQPFVNGECWPAENPDEAPINIEECYRYVSKLIDKAGDIILKANSTRVFYKQKANEIDLITETDKAVENFLISQILARFPHHKFIAEETASTTGPTGPLTDAPTWMIDPIDGTMNFVHGFPHSCICVGLAVNKITEFGVVYNPLLQHRYWAQRGKGAYCNGVKLEVNTERCLSKCLVFSEFGSSRDERKMRVVKENFNKIAARVQGIRSLGSAASNLLMVALGVADVNYEFGVHAWDVCAAELIVREAGGIVVDPEDKPFDIMSRRVLAAANYNLVRQMVPLLTQYYPRPRDDGVGPDEEEPSEDEVAAAASNAKVTRRASESAKRNSAATTGASSSHHVAS